VPDPAISVVIPALDRIEFVGAALASVREQTMPDFEAIVVDAGSVEPVPELVRRVVAEDTRFRLVMGAAPGSGRLEAPVARTVGLEHARSPFVVMLDCDDLMAPRRLELQLAALTADPGLVCVAGAMRPVDASGHPLVAGEGRALTPLSGPGAPAPAPRLAQSDAEIRWTLPFNAPSLASTLAFRADALRAIGGFDRVHRACDDYATMWLLSRRGRLRWLPERMADYRRHSGQMSWGRRGEQEAQLVLLRRAMISERVGRRVPLATVAALTRSRLVAAPGFVDDALSVCDELLRRFVEEVHLSADEDEWVRADHARRREALLAKAGSA